MLTVGAVNHNSLSLLLVLQHLLGSLDALLVVVGTLGSSTQNNEAVLVTLGASNSSKALLGHTHEVVLSSSSANGINGNAKVSISAVLEANRERETRSKLSVELRLGGSGTNGTNGDTVGQELGGDGVEHFARNGHTLVSQVDEELARDAETLIDVEGGVDVRVVDEALPADGCAGLLEVGSHDDAEVVLELV